MGLFDFLKKKPQQEKEPVKVHPDVSEDRVIQHLVNLTHPDAGVTYSDKALKIKEITEAMGCHEDSTLELLGELLEEPLTRGGGKGVGTVWVPLSNPNHHDYPLGEPTMIAHSGNCRGLRIRRGMGNHLPNEIRRATVEEIIKFVRSVGTQKILEHIDIKEIK